MDFPFVIPLGGMQPGMAPRAAIQLVDAPVSTAPGTPSFVFDPTGQVQPYLATLKARPLKVISVGGTFR
jgi:hypothetical protein